MMRPLITAVIIILLVYPCSALKVGIYDNPPLVFKEDGMVEGFYIDILEAVAEKDDWKLEYVYDSFPNLLDRLKDGEIDLLVAVAYTEERAEVLLFNNETVLTNWGIVVAREHLDSILSLEGLKIAGVKEDLYFESLKKLASDFKIDCEFLEVMGDYREVVEQVRSGGQMRVWFQESMHPSMRRDWRKAT